MEGREGPLHFTVEERILLHLLDTGGARDAVEVAHGRTQQGISLAVGIERKHAPRSLRRMMDKGLVEEENRRVEGHRQRMKAYFLCGEGVTVARRLKRHVSGLTITLVEQGEKREMQLLEVPAELGEGFSMARVLSIVSPDGTLDLAILDEVEAVADVDGTGKLEIYRRALAQAWKDGKITLDERDLLRTLRDSLGVTMEQHRELEDEIIQDVEHGEGDEALVAYRVALEQAKADGVITEDEQAILDKIREHFNIEEE